MMEFGSLTNDIIYTRDIPGGSSDFCRVLEQIRILDESEGQKPCVKQDTKLDKKKSKREKEKKSKSDSENNNNNNNNNNRFWRSKKSQNSRDKSPNPAACDSSRGEVVTSSLHSDPSKCKCNSPLSVRTPRETVRAQFSTHLLESPRMGFLQNEDEEFRQRSKSDCSALPPRKRPVLAVAERISPLESLHVHWPDERKGNSLTTTLRPRSFSHGAAGMPQKPILKKGSSGSLRPEYF